MKSGNYAQNHPCLMAMLQQLPEFSSEARRLCETSSTRPPQQLNSLSHRSDSFPAAADQRIAMGRMAKPATAPLILLVAVT
jgi:hypothetical protein